MEKSPENNPVDLPENAEKTSDEEMVDFLLPHIINPCEAEVAPGEMANIRDFYIREARRLLEAMTDDKQKHRLQNYIDIYENKSR